MDVNAAAGGPPEKGLGQDQAVRRNDQYVERDGDDPGAFRFRLEARRLEHRDGARGGQRLDRAGFRPPAAVAGAVGLRKHDRDLQAGVEDCLQGGRGERGRPGEPDSHQTAIRCCFFLIFAASRARLSGDR